MHLYVKKCLAPGAVGLFLTLAVGLPAQQSRQHPNGSSRGSSGAYHGPQGQAGPSSSNPSGSASPTQRPPSLGSHPHPGGPLRPPYRGPGTTVVGPVGGPTGPRRGAGAPPSAGVRGARGPRKPLRKGQRGGHTPVLLHFPVDRWENWWLLNRDALLQVDQSYRRRARVAEPSRDEFLGGAEGEEDPAHPIALNLHRGVARLTPLLEDKLSAAVSMVRGEAALALGKVGGREVVPALVAAVRDRNSFVRQMALLGLGHTGAREAVSPLMAFVIQRSHLDTDRAVAALALGLLRDPLALPALTSVLQEHGRDHNVEGAALYALGFIKGDVAANLLVSFMRDKGLRATLQGVVTLALGKRQESEQIPRLIALLSASKTQVRRSAALALGGQRFISSRWAMRDDLLMKLKEWTDKGILGPGPRRAFEDHLALVERDAVRETHHLQLLRREVVKALGHALERDSDTMVRNFAAIALGRVASDEVRPILVRSLRHSGSESTRGFLALALALAQVREAVPSLRYLAQKTRTDSSLRAALGLALGLLKDKSSGPFLLDLALSRTNDSRGFAAVGCGIMDYKEAGPPFRNELKNEAQAYLRPAFGLALGLLGDHQAIEFLRSLIAQKKTGVTRIQAAQSLGRIRDLDSLQVLARALESPKATDLEQANFLHAAGQVAEKGTLPVLEPMARDWNYLLDFPVIQDILER